jgi:hypothetical protein
MEMVLERLILPVLQIMLFRTNIFLMMVLLKIVRAAFIKSHLQLWGEYLYCHCNCLWQGGVATNTTIQVTVLSDFKDEQAVQFLTGGASKKWYWAQTGSFRCWSHVAWADPNFGTQNYYPSFYGAQPNES